MNIWPIGNEEELVFDEKGLAHNVISTERRTHIADFVPIDVRRVDVVRDGNTIVSVKFSVSFLSGDTSAPITIPLQDLEDMDWFGIDPRCILNPTLSKSKGKACLAYIISQELRTAETEMEYHISRLGTHVIEGVAVFFTGDRLIWPRQVEMKPPVIWHPKLSIRLAADPNCTVQDADAGMMKIVSLSHEAGTTILAFNLLNVMREAFVSAGVNPRCCVFLYGPTGVKKTTYAVFQSQLHNRDVPIEAPARLNASIPAAQRILYEKSDCTVVLDDLFPAQEREIRRQQEKTLFEITRIVADGIEAARVRGSRVSKEPPRCGVLFTGEYYIGEGSDAARLLPVKMTMPIDNNKLSACQQEPLILSTFYSNFIEWYVSNFDEIVCLIKEWMTVYRSTKTEIHGRLQESQFCFEAAFKLLLTYRKEKGFITQETMVEQYNTFYQHLRTIIKEQNARVNRSVVVKHDRADYLQIIRRLYCGKYFRLAKSGKDFEVKVHDGVLHDDYLYLRLDKLLAKIRTVEPSADFDDIIESLKVQQALKTGRGSTSRKLSGSGLRFYAIRLAKLR